MTSENSAGTKNHIFDLTVNINKKPSCR